MKPPLLRHKYKPGVKHNNKQYGNRFNLQCPHQNIQSVTSRFLYSQQQQQQKTSDTLQPPEALSMVLSVCVDLT